MEYMGCWCVINVALNILGISDGAFILLRLDEGHHSSQPILSPPVVFGEDAAR